MVGLCLPFQRRTLGLDDVLIGRSRYDSSSRGAVAAHGGTYQSTLSTSVPGVQPGDYHVIVRSNLLRGLPESEYEDNLRASSNVSNIDVVTLAVGVTDTGDVDYREALYYKIEVTPDNAGGALLLKFGTSVATVANELYLRRDTLPTRADYGVRSEQYLASEQWLIAYGVQPGTYYVMAAAAPDQLRDGALGTYNIHVDLFAADEIQVFDSSYGQGGTAGNRTIEINGLNFDRTVTAHLTNGTNVNIEASDYYRVDSEKLFATFDLTQVPPGVYDVVLENAAQQQLVVTNGLEVIESAYTSEVGVTVTAPPGVPPALSRTSNPFPGRGALVQQRPQRRRGPNYQFHVDRGVWRRSCCPAGSLLH